MTQEPVPAIAPKTRRDDDVENELLPTQLLESVEVWIDAVAKKLRQETKKRPLDTDSIMDWASTLNDLHSIQMTVEGLNK